MGRYDQLALDLAVWIKINKVNVNNIDAELFNRTEIHPSLYENFANSLHEGDALGMLTVMNSEYGMNFVKNNILQLQACNLYEKAIVQAYTRRKDNFCHWKIEVIKHMLDIANKDILYSTGDNVEDEYPIVVYRGISGSGSKYRPRGISWTSDFEKAKWFATYFNRKHNANLPNCHVYETKIQRKNVYFYWDERNEKEFVCNITPKHPVKLIWDAEKENNGSN